MCIYTLCAVATRLAPSVLARTACTVDDDYRYDDMPGKPNTFGGYCSSYQSCRAGPFQSAAVRTSARLAKFIQNGEEYITGISTSAFREIVFVFFHTAQS